MTGDLHRPAEQALHEQREWLRVTLSSIGDAVITTDTQGRVTFLNPVAETLTGWTQAEASGLPLASVFEIINEDSRRPVENPAIRALREGVVVGLANHSLLVARDGTERPIDDSAAPIRNAQGEIAGVVLVFRDVTERRRAERSVRDALVFAEDVIATLREPFLVLDESLRVKTANRAFYLAFQVSPEETEGRLLQELGNGQWNIPGLRKLLGEVLPGDGSFHDFEVENTFPSIGRRVMLLNARRVRREGSQAGLILLAIEDVTDRRAAQEALKLSEVRYRRLFETARDGILILDASTGWILDANPFMSELLGYTHEELVGKELWQVGLFEDIEASRAAFQELQENGYIRYEHLPLATRSGETAEVEFVSNVYAEDHGAVIQCNIRDITQRRRLERQMEEQAVALADAHRRKDEFLAMLSHELRNPLAPIVNAVYLLRLQKDENPIQQQARSIIERQVGQMARLVDDLLEISRITLGRVRLHEELVLVSAIAERAVETVRPLIDKRRQSFTAAIPAEPLWLYADPLRIEQVVVNLLTNAAKYTDEGGRIELAVQQEGDEVAMRVRDTGIGIAPELLPSIFDLFTQADRSLDRAYGGLGIGLALVERLVEMHRGTVEAYSAGTGRGSEFIVRLPLAVPTPAVLPGTGPLETAERTARPLRLLVVDDNADAADSTAILLRLSGHEVRTAYSGRTALEMALEEHPDIVLLDIGLPEIDGYEVARRLRQASPPGEPQGILLVAMTGYGQDADLQRAREAGFDHHLVKPVDLKRLYEIIAARGGLSVT